MLSSLEVCRLCLGNTQDLKRIFPTDSNEDAISTKIAKYLEENITEDDLLPKFVCENCILKIDDFDTYYKNVKSNQNKLKSHVFKKYIEESCADETKEVGGTGSAYTELEIVEECASDTEMEPSNEDEFHYIIETVEQQDQSHSENSNHISNQIICMKAATECEEKSDGSTIIEYLEEEYDAASEFINEKDDEMILENTEQTLKIRSLERKLMKNGRLIVDRHQLINKLPSFYNFTCKICENEGKPTRFLKINEVLSHYKTVHSKPGYIECCSKKLTTYKEMCLHYILHVEPEAFDCTICGRRLMNSFYMRHHMKCHETDGDFCIRCNVCNKKFISEHFLEVHKNKVHDNEENNDMETVEDEIKPHPDFPGFPRTIVKKGKLMFRGAVLMELMAKFFKFSCELCEVGVFPDLSSLFDHYKDVHQTPGYVKCCGIKFDARRTLQFHLASHLDPNVFKCSYCGKQLNSPNHLRNHIQKHKPPEELPYFCPECPKRYSSRTGLDKHMVVHIPPEKRTKHICDECGKVFFTSGALRTHIKYLHGDEKLVCDQCGKQCKNKPILVAHMARHDKRSKDSGRRRNPKSRDPPFPWETHCSICDISFEEKTTLQKHMDEKHDVVHKCDKCSYQNRKWALFSRHMTVQHSNKRYSCHLCDRAFRYSFLLRDHIQTHLGERKYACEFCGKKYASVSGFCRHRRDAHAEEYEASKQNRKKRLKARPTVIKCTNS